MAAATFRGTTSGDETGGKQRGSMAAIGLGPSEMEPYMESGVVIACENSQLSVTISGDAEQVDKVVKNVKRERPGVLARALKVEKAFHSREYILFSYLLLPWGVISCGAMASGSLNMKQERNNLADLI